jgi:iron-sulfur cluster repair protein YtfE (RIC family)
MPKRNPALIPLTHDHHHALAQCRRLRTAATGDARERLAQAESFVGFFRSDTVAHFREEEEIVFPLVVGEPRARLLLTKILIEHLEVHAGVARLAGEVADRKVSQAAAEEVAKALESHIRLEEKDLFPLLEEIVPPNRLAEVSLAPRKRTPASGDANPAIESGPSD